MSKIGTKPSRTAIAATAVAFVVACGGFALGRLTAPQSDDRAGCEDARRLYTDSMGQSNSSKAEFFTSLAAHAVLQNSRCFSATERASAQVYLDRSSRPAAAPRT